MSKSSRAAGVGDHGRGRQAEADLGRDLRRPGGHRAGARGDGRGRATSPDIRIRARRPAAERARHLLDQVEVADDLGTADLDLAPDRLGHVERLAQVVDDVGGADRLRLGVQPAGRREHRQPLDDPAQELVGLAARDRSPSRRGSRSAADPHRRSASATSWREERWREVASVAEPAEIDDALDPGARSPRARNRDAAARSIAG